MRRVLIGLLCVCMFVGFVSFAAAQAGNPPPPAKDQVGKPNPGMPNLTPEQRAKMQEFWTARMKIADRLATQDDELKKIQAQITDVDTQMKDLMAKRKDLNKQREERLKVLLPKDSEAQALQKQMEEFRKTLPPPPQPAPGAPVKK